MEEFIVKKLFIDAEIDIKKLSVEEILLLEDSTLIPDDDDDWFPGIW